MLNQLNFALNPAVIVAPLHDASPEVFPNYSLWFYIGDVFRDE